MALLEHFTVETKEHCCMVDITSRVQQLVHKTGTCFGICVVFIPHTTAGITINENADPDVVRDLTMEIGRIVPFSDNYAHAEGNSAAHLKTTLYGASETIIIENERLLLGMWQGIYLCEFDGPRTRKVYVKIIEG